MKVLGNIVSFQMALFVMNYYMKVYIDELLYECTH